MHGLFSRLQVLREQAYDYIAYSDSTVAYHDSNAWFNRFGYTHLLRKLRGEADENAYDKPRGQAN